MTGRTGPFVVGQGELPFLYVIYFLSHLMLNSTLSLTVNG